MIEEHQPAGPATTDRTFDLIEAHRKVHQEYERLPEDDEDGDAKLGKLLFVLESRLLAEPASTIEGLAAKFRYMRTEMDRDSLRGCLSTEEYLSEFLDMLVASVDRLA